MLNSQFEVQHWKKFKSMRNGPFIQLLNFVHMVFHCHRLVCLTTDWKVCEMDMKSWYTYYRALPHFLLPNSKLLFGFVVLCFTWECPGSTDILHYLAAELLTDSISVCSSLGHIRYCGFCYLKLWCGYWNYTIWYIINFNSIFQ